MQVPKWDNHISDTVDVPPPTLMNGRESVGKAVRIPEIRFDFHFPLRVHKSPVAGPVNRCESFAERFHRTISRRDDQLAGLIAKAVKVVAFNDVKVLGPIQLGPCHEEKYNKKNDFRTGGRGA